MRKTPTDRLLLGFAKRRDPAALAAVFDLLAPKLYGLAIHLCSRTVDAEDALQTTFLAVIESIDDWDQKRPAEPWITGILRNRVRSVRSTRSSAPLKFSNEVGALVVSDGRVETRETERAVIEAVEELSTPDRRIIILSAWYGMKPAEIAHALNQTPGTVRVRLHRALKQLEKRLGAGFATSAALLALSTPGLAQVRELIISKASVARSPQASSFLLGGVAVTKAQAGLAAGVGIVLLVAALAWHNLNSPDSALKSEPSTEASELEAPRNTMRKARREEPRGGQETADSSPTNNAPIDATRKQLGDISIKVTWHDGTAAKGVTLKSWPRGSQPFFLYAERYSTDQDGYLLLKNHPLGDYLFYATHNNGSFAATVVPGGLVEGELRIDKGRQVRGVVVNERGEAQPGAAIWVSIYGNTQEGFQVSRADDQGRFELGDLGEQRCVAARAPDHAPSPAIETGQLQSNSIDLRLVVNSHGRSLRGIVVDPRGYPVPGAALYILGTSDHSKLARGESPPPPQILRTDAEGRFVCSGIGSGPVDVLARAPGFGCCTERLAPGTAPHEVRMVLPQGGIVRGRVIDGDGNAVAAAVVICSGAHDFEYCRSLSDENGQYRMIGLPTGNQKFRSVKRGLGKASETIFVTNGKELTWNPVIDAGRSIRGHLLAADGSAISGASISAFDVHPRQRPPKFIANTKTDTDGDFSIPNCPDIDLIVSVYDATDKRVVKTLPGIRAGGGELVIKLDPPTGSYVVGRVLTHQGEASKVKIVPVRGSEIPSVFADKTTGRFRIGPFAEGRHPLIAEIDPLGSHKFEAVTPAGSGLIDLGSIQLPRPGNLSIAVSNLPIEAKVFSIRVTEAQRGWREFLFQSGKIPDQIELPPGEYNVHINGQGIRPGTQRRVSIVSGELKKLRLELP
ncbi:MAG: sigma-70 family RNA polymerase sigma factor [Planctomycetota bacterium]